MKPIYDIKGKRIEIGSVVKYRKVGEDWKIGVIIRFSSSFIVVSKHMYEAYRLPQYYLQPHRIRRWELEDRI